MVKLESLKKSNQFKKALKEKNVHSEYFSIFAAKNFYKPKFKRWANSNRWANILKKREFS